MFIRYVLTPGIRSFDPSYLYSIFKLVIHSHFTGSYPTDVDKEQNCFQLLINNNKNSSFIRKRIKEVYNVAYI